MVEGGVSSVKVCKNICWNIVIEECGDVCVRRGGVCRVWYTVGGGHENGAVLSEKLCGQEVWQHPLGDKFVLECVLDEDRNAVVRCICGVTCRVSP